MSPKRPDPAAARYAGFEELPVRVVVRVGRHSCALGRLAELQPGDVIPLDRRVGDPFELCAGPVVLGRVEPVSDKDRIAIKLVEVEENDDEPGD